MREEDIKKKMIQKRFEERIQQQALQQMQEQQMLQEQLQILKMITSRILEPKARERLSNLKLVKPQLALQLEVYLVQLYQSGQLRGKITEEQLISILRKVSEKKEFRIKRK